MRHAIGVGLMVVGLAGAIGCGGGAGEPDVTCVVSGDGSTQICGDGNRFESPSADGNVGVGEAGNPRSVDNSVEVTEEVAEEDE